MMMQQSRPDDQAHHVAGHWLGKDVLVWSAEGAERLKREWRVVGGRIGANPHSPRQNTQLGLPLLLQPEEVALLCKKGVLKLEGGDEEHTDSPSEQQTLRTKIFCDLWEKGYHLTSALKYGGDFLLYSKHPSLTHSAYIAVVLSWQQPLNTLVSLARVAGKAKKQVLLCSEEAREPCYYTLQWAADMQ